MNTFRHSGKLGDIIYSLPAVRALGGGIFYVDAATQYPGKPPLGKKTAEMMVEPLETQDYIHHAAVFSGESVSCDFDRFRMKAVPIHIFNTLNSETDKVTSLLFGSFVRELRRQIVPTIEIDLSKFHWEVAGLSGELDRNTPFLTGIAPKPIADIVISRTDRYAGKLDWLRLKNYAARSVFVGLEEEWRAFCAAYFHVNFYQVNGLLDFAQIVAGAKLYVGNQSFGLALADAMLIPRIAEFWEPNPVRLSPIHCHNLLTQEVVEAYIQS